MWGCPPLFVDKPVVCQRGIPGRLSTHRPRLTAVRCSVAAHYASLRVLATSALRASAARKLACGSPCLIGLTPRCFAHRARASCAPRGSSRFAASAAHKLACGTPCFTGLIGGYCTLNSQWSSCCALRLAVLPCSLGLLRPVSRTARGEAPSHRARASCAPPPLPHPQFAMVVPHLRTALR